MGASPCIWPDVPGCMPANGYRYVGTSGLGGMCPCGRFNVHPGLRPYAHLGICPGLHPGVHLCIRLGIYLDPCPCVHPGVRPYVHLCVHQGGQGRMHAMACGEPSGRTYRGIPRWTSRRTHGSTQVRRGLSGCMHRGVLARKYRRTGISRWEKWWENRYGNR